MSRRLDEAEVNGICDFVPQTHPPELPRVSHARSYTPAHSRTERRTRSALATVC
jgi:hypothetical protein